MSPTEKTCGISIKKQYLFGKIASGTKAGDSNEVFWMNISSILWFIVEQDGIVCNFILTDILRIFFFEGKKS